MFLNIVLFIGRSILESTANVLETKATVATTYSHTRFASSAFVQWHRLVCSYRLLVEAWSAASGKTGVEAEDEPDLYKIRGQVL
jgi:hypothetical protein